MRSSFYFLALSNLFAHAAQQVAMAAAPIIAVTLLHASVGQVAWIQLAAMMPFLMFSIPAGVLADRMAPKALLLSGEAVRTLALIGVLMTALSGALDVRLLVTLGFFGSVGALAYGVAVPSMTLDLVERHALPAANAKIELMRSMAFIGGPAVAGALIAWLGGNESLGAAALLSVTAFALASTLPSTARPLPNQRHFRAEMMEGARFVAGDVRLRSALLVSVIYNASFFVLQTALVPYATRHLGMSAGDIGGALAFYGIGMIFAGLVAPRLSAVMSIGRLLSAGILSGLLASIFMPATIAYLQPSLVSVSFFVFGAGGVLWAVGFTTLRQTVTPASMMGRVTSINALATYGARPLGAAIAGIAGTAFGVKTCLLIVAAAFLLQVVVFFRSPLSATHIRSMN